jgi:membrane-associated protein
VFESIFWVLSMTMLGFTLSKMYPPITKQIDKLIIVIIAVSLMPAAISWVLNRRKARTASKNPTVPA